MVTKGEKRIMVVETRMILEDGRWFKLAQDCVQQWDSVLPVLKLKIMILVHDQ